MFNLRPHFLKAGNNPFRRHGLAGRILMTLALASGTPIWAGTLQGMAMYRERIALPPGAVFEAVLEDVSRADAGAEILGRATIDPAGSPPFRFEIQYDDAALLPGRRYTVRASITHQRQILFTANTGYPLPGGGNQALRLLLVSARSNAGNPESDSSLRNTYWKLVSLGGKPVKAADRQREPHLIFSADQPRVSGSGGCNRIMGSFKAEVDKLTLGQMAGTMMACQEGMEQEQEFLQALDRVERFRITGGHLELLNGSGEAIARFDAVALR